MKRNIPRTEILRRLQLIQRSIDKKLGENERDWEIILSPDFLKNISKKLSEIWREI